jgi:hypothetical protein
MAILNKYKVTFNYQGELNVMTTEAADNYHAILRCMPIMAKKYGVKKDTMIHYFSADKLNCEANLI